MFTLMVSLLSTSAVAGKGPCRGVQVEVAEDPFTKEDTVEVRLGADRLAKKGDEITFAITIMASGVVDDVLAAGFEFQWLLADGTIVSMQSVADATPKTNTGYDGTFIYTTYSIPTVLTPDTVRQVGASPPVVARYTLQGREHTNDLKKKVQGRLQAAFSCFASHL